MEAREFVSELVSEMESLFSRLGEREALEAESGGQLDVVTLLKLALASELEASEIAGHWLATTPEMEAKMLLAAQCGDEMRHYRLIHERLEALGEDMAAHDPLADGYSPLYEYLKALPTTIERIAAGPFAHEAVAEVRNAQFIAFCRAAGDPETARLYEETIQPEEVHHKELGRAYLERHATTPESQERAARAVREALAIADELRTLAERSTGLSPIPSS